MNNLTVLIPQSTRYRSVSALAWTLGIASYLNQVAMQNIFLLILILLLINGILKPALGQETNTEECTVAPFDRLILHGGGNVQVMFSDSYFLKVKRDGQCLVQVDYSVASRTLKINISRESQDNCNTEFYIGAPNLHTITQVGGGVLQLQPGFTTQDLFHYIMVDGGEANVSELSVNSFHASIHGGGTLQIHAEKELNGTIVDGGRITFTGNPKVSSSISGGGDIRHQ